MLAAQTILALGRSTQPRREIFSTPFWLYYPNFRLRKTNAKSIIGTAGVREILGAIADAGHHTQTVCIGGVNGSNLERVMFQCGSPQKSLDGVAVVSAIMAAPDPEGEARRLLGLVGAAPLFRQCAGKKDGKATEPGEIIALIPAVINAVHSTTPLSHNMTNLVSQSTSVLQRGDPAG